MTGASGLEIFWWAVIPYVAIAIFVVGHIWRYRYDQFGWTTRSTELQEKRWLRWGGPIFHYATFLAIAGHVIGILIPASWTRAIGISEPVYRWFSASAGTVAVVGVLVGIAILAGRRILVARVRATTSPVDWFILIVLLIEVVFGLVMTTGINLLGSGYNYRTTVSVWFRSLFAGDPNVHAIASAPVLYQIHVSVAWLIIAAWPFTRLVHAWSAPVWYMWRPFVVYRSRRASRPTEPGTSGRRWRRIGVPY
ncbi:respiratory nitrate reductase subunit gamma [Aciditerrimonas ferrireducens]|uniref:Respiratory nitrate reductase subunit gamma n=1 Tax=Aciditerrimonas ferrireducens TaxID=667306 RepID=A0ABV6C3G1_9ACTN